MESHTEPHSNKSVAKINALRAAVLGANDGIVSVASIIVGVAGANSSKAVILTSGIAGLAAGALSMAAGEYISVSSQKDTQKALIEKERQELIDFPEEELKELKGLYEKKGLSSKTAMIVAKELTAKDAFAAHLDIELGIDPDDLTNPTHAAIASALSFFIGAIIPLLAVAFSPEKLRIIFTFISAILALTLTGVISAKVGGANKTKATLRVVIGGILAMAITYSIGKIVGVTVG